MMIVSASFATQSDTPMHMLSKPAKIDHRGADSPVSDGWLAGISWLAPDEACTRMDSTPDGLSAAEAAARLKKLGPNLVARASRPFPKRSGIARATL